MLLGAASRLRRLANPEDQMPKAPPRSPKQPRIHITAQDLETVETLLGRSASGGPALALLEAEIERAVIVDEASTRRTFCRIGSWVTYEDLTSGQLRTIQLVMPADADIDRRKISVLSMAGAALLGLGLDTEFSWTDANARTHRLKVLKIDDQEPGAEAPLAPDDIAAEARA
jgi:regulator of nucleoside diphosphate kinase